MFLVKPYRLTFSKATMAHVFFCNLIFENIMYMNEYIYIYMFI